MSRKMKICKKRITNTPLYGLNSIPLITMIEQKKFRASYEIHSNQDLEHNFLYIFFSITRYEKSDYYFFKPSNLRFFNLSFSHNV